MIGVICFFLVAGQGEPDFLPQWMTPAESLLIHEIGKGHVITAPPGMIVETPAEYEPARGVFVTWIYGYSTYRPIFREIVRNTVMSCKAYIITSSSDTSTIKTYLTTNGVPLDSVRFYTYPYNSIWIRDYGPWFIRKQNNTEGIVDYKYNRPRPADDTIPWRIGQSWGIPVYGSPLAHPGGNFMVDGHGTGFASNLIYEENSGYTQSQIATMMYQYNGLEQFIPVKRIITEYTGHIDLWTKQLNDTLVMVGKYASGHFNDTVLNNRADSISRCVNRDGYNYRVLRIPMPWSTSDAPPTYLNSLFVNDRVLVPTWGLSEDTTAIRIYQEALPGYTIVGINCSAMSGSGGAIHCITMQVPKSQFVHIQHTPLNDTNDTLNPYRVRARIIYAGSLLAESTLVFYRVNSGSMTALSMTAVVDTPGVYAGHIPAQSPGDTVHYYLLAKNSQSIRKTCPSYVPPQIFTFHVTGNPAAYETSAISPFSASVSTRISRDKVKFALKINEPGRIKIDIYNALGQKIIRTADQAVNRGDHVFEWAFRDDSGLKLSQGAYFYSVELNGQRFSGKVLHIK